MPSMTRYRAGDVVLIRFPFTDLTADKKRPAVILNPPGFTARHGDVVVLALTSQPQPDDSLKLSQWKSAGLPKPTWLKPIIGTIASQLVIRRIGRIHAADHPRIK
jgi:mRNA interferase MazF